MKWFHLVIAAQVLGACQSTQSGGGSLPVPTPALDASTLKFDAGTTADTPAPACIDDCAKAGATYCTPTGKVALCAQGGDGCRHGGTPEACDPGTSCVEGKCVAPVCIPSCDGSSCGPDGCGGTCTCANSLVCEVGKCVTPVCSPACSGQDCGTPDGCGGTCTCAGGLLCDSGKCKLPCTKADNSCSGDVLTFCAADGLTATTFCSDSQCQQGGYLGFDSCGPSSAGYTACLCTACTTADNICVSGGAQVCDSVTKKVSVQACGGGKVCKNGACVVPCTDECSADSCAGGYAVSCVKGSDGCMKKLTPAACSTGLVCKAGAKGCGACTAHADCAYDSICAPGFSCTTPDYVPLTVTIYSAEYPQHDATGAAWDAFGGLPDPKICINDYTKDLVCTKVKSDTLTASFYETFSVTLFAGDKLCFIAYDEDLTANDQADAVCWSSYAGIIKSGGYSGMMYNGLVSFGFSISTGI